jgi:hypothetical protein
MRAVMTSAGVADRKLVFLILIVQSLKDLNYTLAILAINICYI